MIIQIDQTKAPPNFLAMNRGVNPSSSNAQTSHAILQTDCQYLVIDEDIYESPPSLIIGTVDKFARLSWTAAARSIFGIDKSGSRLFSPPRLIIQDELHLISGPLGSMVGLYETVIEELCTVRRDETPIKPKIICSTATIRRSANQIKALFGRCESALFPPPGLDAGDSFFASFAHDDDGKLCPGKVSPGLLAPSRDF